jgi:hypothetical protein
MRQLNNEEFHAVEKILNDLKTCFENALKTSSDQGSKLTLNYVLKVIAIHKDLAELDWQYTMTKFTSDNE